MPGGGDAFFTPKALPESSGRAFEYAAPLRARGYISNLGRNSTKSGQAATRMISSHMAPK